MRYSYDGWLVAGEFLEGDHDIEVKSPYDDSTVGTVSIPEDIDSALEDVHETATRGFEAWKDVPTWRVREVLEEASEAVSSHEKELAELLALEGGKPVSDARFEVFRTSEVLRLSASEAERIRGETLPPDAQRGRTAEAILTFREPVGRVLSITPFNFPLLLPAHKVGPALAAGCSVVHKPATATPLSSMRLAEILLDAGLEPEALSVVVGPGRELGDALVSMDFEALSFTGSKAVGEAILEVTRIPRVTLELGGNDPLIVDETVDDVERIARDAVRAACYHAGQVCIAVERAIVVSDVYEEFVEAAAEAAEGLKVGDPLDEDTDVGPLIDDAAVDKVREHVKDAVERGAEVVTGGEPEGRLFPPTVLRDVPRNSLVAREETFGPVLPVIKARDFEEALEIANETGYGLHAAVYTRDLGRAVKAAGTLEAGGVMINLPTLFRADYMPFGGVKGSGVGREGVPYAVREFTEEKTVVLGRPGG